MHMPCQIIQSNLSFSHAPTVTNEITDNNSHPRHHQRVITSKGCHTQDAQPITSEGAQSLAETLSPQPVPKRFLRHCQRDHLPRKQPLVSAASSKRRHPPRHRERNGIHGNYEGSPSTTTLETRLWQRMWKPIPRHSGYCGHRYMFLYQTQKHPERQKDHLRQNSVRLQTSQERKGTRPADRGRRHTRLLYYLCTPLPPFEYMKMLLSRFPEEIVQKYNLNALAVDGWVYIEIRNDMYPLKQAGLLVNQLLQTFLAPFGYYPARHTHLDSGCINSANLFHSRSGRLRS
jgi:hypothetical protein